MTSTELMPRDLLQHADEQTDDEHAAQRGARTRAAWVAVRVSCAARHERPRARCRRARRRGPREDAARGGDPAVHGEPARTFRHEPQRKKIGNGRQRANAEHPAPVPVGEMQAGQPVELATLAAHDEVIVGRTPANDARNHEQLVESHHASAPARAARSRRCTWAR